jgi:hypothetical protein
MERFIKKFKAVAIYREVLTVIILECDHSVGRCVDDGARALPLAAMFSFSEEFYPRIEH